MAPEETQKEPAEERDNQVHLQQSAGGRWKLFGMRSSGPYHPEILWTEIQSSLKELQVDPSPEALSYYHI
jgi:hypothetical protein